jgi:hypothetical protein
VRVEKIVIYFLLFNKSYMLGFELEICVSNITLDYYVPTSLAKRLI